MKRTVMALLVIAACGDNHAALDAAPGPSDDGGGSNDGGTIDGAPPASTAVVVAGDFTAGDPGILSTVDDSKHTTFENRAPGSIGDNPVLRIDTTNGLAFVINSADGDNVTQLDIATYMQALQLSTGSGTNPQDVAVVGTNWYVATFNGGGLEIVDSTNGSGSATQIALGSDDPDGQPNCNSVILAGTNLYVSCELLNNTNVNLPPRGNGVVKVVDTGSNGVSATIHLDHPNPFGLFETLPDGNLAIATIDFASGSGCVEEVDTTNNTAACMAGLNNTDLAALVGGTGSAGSDSAYAIRIAPTADQTELMIAVQSTDFANDQAVLVPYDLASHTLGTPLSSADELITDVATCPDGHTVVSDTGTGEGLRVFSNTAELTTSAVPVGLDPATAHGLQCY